ncbi:hypothetical protein OAR23_00060 [bacterium]|nr:hypothetical protein [bacterium]
MMKILMKTLLPLILLVSATDLIHAQRDGGVQGSIRAAVEAGEISQEQAEAMISAMRKTATKKDEKVGRRLREAVAAGDLTEEQARAMYETYGATKKAPRAERKKDSNKKPRGEDRMAIFRERLGEAVKSGKMTREEAGEKMAAAQKRMQQNSDGDQARDERPRGEKGQERAPRAERKKDSNQKPRGEDRMAIFRERLGEAVRSGEMTRAEAGEKMAAAQKRMQQNSDGDQARDERPRSEKGQERAPRAERKKNAGKKEGKKSTCENCGVQKQRQ